MRSFYRSTLVAWAFAAASAAGAAVATPAPSDAASLRARHAELRPQLEQSAFGRPLHIEAAEAGRTQRGEVYAVVDHPFSVVQRELSAAQTWCDVMILPYNTKHCHVSGGGGATTLAVRVGRKAEQKPEDASAMAFIYAVSAKTQDYMRVTLRAADGPMTTRDYNIALEATPLDDKRTFIHFGYSYGFGAVARLAMQAYLSTAGAHKIGFTVTGSDSAGRPVYVGGMVGASERNAMRYFLAIDAYLASLASPESQRLEKRLNDWYAATVKYPRQLGELERGDYLAMKRREAARMTEAL